MKTLIVGLDGAEPSLVERWKADLPTLTRLCSQGVWGRLNSTVPPATGPAWTSFASGMNPGKHGFFSFGQHKPGTYQFEPGTVGATRGRSLWEFLSDAGHLVGVVGVPGAYPPVEVNGIIVAGLGTPSEDSQYTYPLELKTTLKSRFGYTACGAPGFGALSSDEKLREVQESLDRQLAACEWLLSEYDFDFFITVFAATDLVQHFFWAEMDATHPLHAQRTGSERFEQAVHDIYVRADAAVGRLLKRVDEQVNVFVISDHGFGPHYQNFTLNRWLEERGYLRDRGYQRTRLGMLGRVSNLCERLGVDQETACKIAERLSDWGLRGTRLGRFLNKVAKNLHCYFAAMDIDWAATRAYSMGQDAIYLNIEGRDPCGVVKPGAESEALIAKLREELLDIRHRQTGERLVLDVRRKEEIYAGLHLSDAPDLMLTMKPGYKTWPNCNRRLLVPPPSGRTGDHRQDGIFISVGPDIRSGLEFDADIMDIAPTVLHLMGEPISRDMDGQVLMEIFISDSPANRSVEYADYEVPTEPARSGLSSEEEEQVTERLRGLGYL